MKPVSLTTTRPGEGAVMCGTGTELAFDTENRLISQTVGCATGELDSAMRYCFRELTVSLGVDKGLKYINCFPLVFWGGVYISHCHLYLGVSSNFF